MGEIKVQVSQNGRQVIIAVSDNGPEFPNDLEPGFGIQSIYDKLEILYSGKFEMNFINTPLKQVLIKLN
jgi:glucose-6-phosphate-specific signal transduction histidine kinase